MSEKVYDAAIIGGGPAGTSAAITLAQQGFQVVLFEEKTYPHDKLCGEFLSPECTGLLADLAVSEKIASLRPVQIDAVHLTAPDGTLWETSLPGHAIGLSRRLLDAALAERAQVVGVDLRQATRVNDLHGSLGEGFVLDTRSGSQPRNLRARLVIGAYGKRGILDRVLGRPFFQQPQPFIALKAHFYGPPIPGRVELHGFPGGYCGISEIERDARVVCLLAYERVFQPFRHPGRNAAEAFVDWMKNQNPRLRNWLDHAERIHPRWISIAQVPFVAKPALDQDVLMAGDSAGLVVPLAGNGISMALDGGMLAAQYASAFLHGELPAPDLRQAYPQAWRKRFHLRLRLGRLLQPWMLRPTSLSFALRLLSALPPIGHYLVSKTRGTPRLSVE